MSINREALEANIAHATALSAPATEAAAFAFLILRNDVPDLLAEVDRLTAALNVADGALDQIATRVTPDDYDNPSSALEAIAGAVETTGREIEGY
ncbi:MULTISPECIES: hypothetical protein [unclassified Cryobacterium]|uniref:hypothetical protein n=1 Tax=unclassified Cryobacterium TaxID=2649013 RepID=UPI00106B8505|nr:MULTISPECIES: hypothetical protein [unclassified Cryobacterium]TFC59432.1 hypothetical protein E3O68_00600 [Cryobacterium sp. TMB3-1-2]TFC67228.1 hypothetical protein E3T21_17295 [Cryobacterium sp. TMB3-15]TFC73259.1 hypothetical protein E3T22_16760 [Cryobacterium sp. TMB3-10]TFD46147.1 hypothetical protein E3T58_01395 [Cryobacterium sp. TMB3-12]